MKHTICGNPRWQWRPAMRWRSMPYNLDKLERSFHFRRYRDGWGWFTPFGSLQYWRRKDWWLP